MCKTKKEIQRQIGEGEGHYIFTTGPRGEVRQKLLTTVRDVVKLFSFSLLDSDLIGLTAQGHQ